MNFRTSRMIPPIQWPQIFRVVAVLVFFTMVEFVAAEYDKVLLLFSGESHATR